MSIYAKQNYFLLSFTTIRLSPQNIKIKVNSTGVKSQTFRRLVTLAAVS